jgi:serine phosphatase RsbU (regulator of sigma subunit)
VLPRTEEGPGRPTETAVFHGEHRGTYDVRREPLTDRRGRSAGELVVLRDITERARAEHALEALLAERSRVAAALQASLVPADLAPIPDSELATRYEPAGDGREIGGDFFDVFALNEGTWGVVLGDVSGKGAEAAAVTAQTRYTLRTLADPRHGPSRTLRDLNTRLLGSTETERHCTLVYALVRPVDAGLHVTLSLAGHHPPLVVRADGTVDEVGSLGTVLGLLEDPELHDSGTTLHAGDLICLFTDGLVEARDALELFGTERAAAVLSQLHHLPAEGLAAELVNAARRFRGRELADDLAVLMLRVLPRRVGEHAGQRSA